MRRLLTEQAYAAIYEQIAAGRFIPGSAISEVELSARLSMSRTPVREAVFQLEKDGLLERKNGRLTVVEISYSRVAGLFVRRSAIDGMAARLAASAASPEDVRRLGTLLSDVDRASSEGDIASAADLNVEFHNQIVMMSGNSDLGVSSRQANVLIRRFDHIIASTLMGHSLAWHQAIYESLKEGNPDECELRMRQDILGAGAAVLPVLQTVIGIDRVTPSVNLVLKYSGMSS